MVEHRGGREGGRGGEGGRGTHASTPSALSIPAASGSEAPRCGAPRGSSGRSAGDGSADAVRAGAPSAAAGAAAAAAAARVDSSSAICACGGPHSGPVPALSIRCLSPSRSNEREGPPCPRERPQPSVLWCGGGFYSVASLLGEEGRRTDRTDLRRRERLRGGLLFPLRRRGTLLVPPRLLLRLGRRRRQRRRRGGRGRELRVARRQGGLEVPRGGLGGGLGGLGGGLGSVGITGRLGLRGESTGDPTWVGGTRHCQRPCVGGCHRSGRSGEQQRGPLDEDSKGSRSP